MSESINIVVVDKKFETQALQGLVIRSEGNANTIKIQFPKTYENEDLTNKMFILKCTNANGVYFEKLLQKNVKTDYIELTWVVEPVFTTVSGILKVAVFAESANYSLGTQMSKVVVEESPQIMVPIDQNTVFEQYLKEIRVLADSTESYYEQTLAIKNDFESKIVDNLASTDPQKILSANQGRALNARIDNIVGQTGTSNTEIVDARYSAERNVTYPTLKSRLDAVDGDIVKSKYSAPTTATAPIISLPSTVVKGKVEGSLKGNTLYQAVVNGDFANGTSGYMAISSTLSADNNILSVIGNGTGVSASLLQTINLNIAEGQKYFYKARARVTNAVASRVEVYLRMDSSPNTILAGGVKTVLSPIQNQSYDFFGIATAQAGVSGKLRFQIFHQYPDAATANGKVMEVDGNVGVFAIPITGTPYENWTADQLNDLVNGYWEGLGNSKPAKAKSVGKNLFDGELESGSITTGGILIADATKIRTKNYQKVKPNSVIKITPNAEVVFLFDKFKNYITTVSSSIISIPSNCEYFKFRLAGTDIDLKIMVNEGSTALPYEPYQETELFCPVELGSVPSGVADKFTFDGKYIQRTKEYALQSGDIISIFASGINIDVVLFKKNVDDINYNSAIALSTNPSIIFPNFKCGIYADSINNIGMIYNVNNTNYGLIVPKGTYANLAAAQTALAGTKIRYQLATPVEIQYPASNLIAESSGTIYVDSAIKVVKPYKTNNTLDVKIKNLISVTKVDGENRVPILLSLVNIATDGMSLTILNASSGDMYEVEYETFGATLPTVEYSYPSNLAGAVLGNTESIKEIDLTLESFMALQNAMNVEFDFRLTAGGH